MRILPLLLALLMALPSAAQSQNARKKFNQMRQKRNEKFQNEKSERDRKFDELRRQRNEKFAQLLSEPWVIFDSKPKIELPKEKDVPPMVTPVDKVPQPKPQPKPIPYKEVVKVPKPKPQPQPEDPIVEVKKEPVKKEPVKKEPVKKEPVKNTTAEPMVQFAFLGTSQQVRVNKKGLFRLKDTKEKTVADAWRELSTQKYNNLVYDCLQIRKKGNLSDWAYLSMLQRMSEAVCGKGTNEQMLLMAYVYCQSGYSMRLATQNAQLKMLFSCDNVITNWDYFILGNENFYPIDNKNGGRYVISNKQYPKEQRQSLDLSQQQKLGYKETAARTHQSKKFANVSTTSSCNQHLLDFYSSYPRSVESNQLMSQWAHYANTPMSQKVKEQIYPKLKAALAGDNELAAVNKLLNLVQTGFVYEYDDKVWGGDRPFFPEESLHYPYCDCEDRSILLTRLVRDLLRLRCLLVYYPGHLASAVEIKEGNPVGDYILYKGSKYYIADGTITGYGAPVGVTMRGMDNNAAKVILLE